MRFKGAVQSGVPVVVSSTTGDSIASSANLAIVPYGSGEIVVRRSFGKTAEIVSHYFGGEMSRSQAQIQSAELKFAAFDRSPAGKPLEWIEVRING